MNVMANGLKCYGECVGSCPGLAASLSRIVHGLLVCSDLLADRIDLLLG
jgi:hypothetical protein